MCKTRIQDKRVSLFHPKFFLRWELNEVNCRHQIIPQETGINLLGLGENGIFSHFGERKKKNKSGNIWDGGQSVREAIKVFFFSKAYLMISNNKNKNKSSE